MLEQLEFSHRYIFLDVSHVIKSPSSSVYSSRGTGILHLEETASFIKMGVDSGISGSTTSVGEGPQKD